MNIKPVKGMLEIFRREETPLYIPLYKPFRNDLCVIEHRGDQERLSDVPEILEKSAYNINFSIMGVVCDAETETYRDTPENEGCSK